MQELIRKINRAYNLRGVFRVKPWLDYQIKRGRLKPQWLELLPKIEKVLEDTYPGEWDIHAEVERKSVHRRLSDGSYEYKYYWAIKFLPIVHFPEVEVTNSQKVKIKIKDLYLGIELREYGDEIRFENIVGTRTSVTVEEFYSNYMHSHLSSDFNRLGFHNFCLGEGEMRQIMLLLNSNLDENLFKLALLQLKTLAEWESLEGVPYRKISQVFLRQTGGDSLEPLEISQLQNYYRDIILYAKDEDKTVNWKFSLEGLPIIVDDQKFENFCKYAGEDGFAYSSGSIYYRDEITGSYYPYHPPTNGSIENMLIDSLPWRGREIPFTVEGNFRAENITDEFFIHPKIKEYVKQQLESRAKAQVLRENFIDEFQPHQSDNVRTNTGQDQIHLQSHQ